ncbi:MAG: hypothetical protein JJE42_05230 [Burkholderiales bacterium]|nr:hypothetical protein [Burkholderiales bacterium]
MKKFRAEYSLSEIPEMEETEFEFSVSSHQRFEDANDFGHMGDSISISMDLGDA